MKTKKLTIKFNIGDYVKIISGKEKNKKGKIKQISNNKKKVIIENINLKTKHIKPKNEEEKGIIKKIESYIHISNIKKNI